MEISCGMEKDFTVIGLNGRLEATQAAALNESILTALREGSPMLTLDCTGLDYVASMGLRCFLLAHKEVQKAGGKLVFFGLNDNVRSVFAMTGFDKIAHVRQDREDALACLR
ncbi:MAG: STAS domain-containing protein [Desulfovibrio sp.]|jgi:anti-anti-sigma factor|nr:STAS domain-containing protein [Desulfovibrio sp.]